MNISRNSKEEITNGSFYDNSVDQILEYLKVLDLMLQIELIRYQLDNGNDSEQFKGLVIRAEEVYSLLCGSKDASEEIDDIVYLENQISVLEKEIELKSSRSMEKGINLALEVLGKAFGLTCFEKYVLILSAAVDMDIKYEKVFGFLSDDITIKRPSIGLAFRILLKNNKESYKYRQILSEGSVMHEFFLNKDDVNTQKGFLSQELKLDKRILGFLVEDCRVDGNIRNFSKLTGADKHIEPLILNEGIHQKIVCFAEHGFSGEGVIFNLWGPHGAGKTFQIMHLCSYLDKPLLEIDAGIFLQDDIALNELITKIIRESVISNAILCIKHMEVLLNENSNSENSLPGIKFSKILHELLWRTKAHKLILFMLSEYELNFERDEIRKDVIAIKLEIPDVEQRHQLWKHFAAGYSFDCDVEWGLISGKFRFTPGQIKDVLVRANRLSRSYPSCGNTIKLDELNKACHDIGNRKMSRKAVRISPGYSWEDVILPKSSKEQLENACNQIKYRHIVFGKWGFGNKLSYGKGLSILFSGPPGTGKTMSAQIIAKELGLELYRVDISQLVSKYIGETEKNIQEVFYWAQMSNAILFFDEADALFGKRSEVKDSHDRYSNIETAFLLQKIEEYEGISILATNYIKNIDEAFMRRFNYVIEFPFPDAGLRYHIWSKVFPDETPLDAEIDVELIAEKFEVSGGNIKNIALSAAFMAAECGEAVKMKHIIRAARDELNKTGKIYSSSDFEDYYDGI